MNFTNMEQLNNLSEKEREYVLSILRDMSNGESSSYSDLMYDDYDEIPVDIETFLHDKNYLGSGLTDDEGRFTVFPYWEQKLHKIFPTNIDTAYNTLILSGAIGLGKSFVAVICILYMLYRMLCLKDPYKHYGLQPIDKITFSFMNITLEAAKGVAWDKCQQLLQSSPWFMSHGWVNKAQVPEWQPRADLNIELMYGSAPRNVIGRAVFASFEDEISFIQTQDIEKQKKKARELVSSIDARMQSRFMKGEHLPTLHILASSKRSDQSFLETYIDMKKKNESKTTLIVDEPQWVIRTDKDSPRKFYVAVGNKFLDSELLPLNVTERELSVYRDRGFYILKVPMGYYEQFRDDLDIALTDIAGISSTNSMNYISGVRWAQCKKDSILNPFVKEIITVGNGLDDNTQYYNFFDLKRVPDNLRSRPLYIHLDMSMTGDKTGIGGVWILGKKPHQEGVPDSKELYYRVAFNVSVKAPKGHQVSFEKNRQFIYWLKENGFNIKSISYDTFQSADLGQTLIARGYNCKVISVDRLQDKINVPYQVFKNAIYEQRVEVYPSTLLTDEIIGLVRDSNGKIDHTPNGINSKDSADAVCGALYDASTYAEEFAFDYGEMYDTMDKVNSYSSTSEGLKRQIALDFEEELKNISNFTYAKQEKKQNGLYKDFGFGPSKPVTWNDFIIL